MFVASHDGCAGAERRSAHRNRMGELRQGRAAYMKEAGFCGVGNGRRHVVSNVVLSSRRLGSGPGGWEGARSGQ